MLDHDIPGNMRVSVLKYRGARQQGSAIIQAVHRAQQKESSEKGLDYSIIMAGRHRSMIGLAVNQSSASRWRRLAESSTVVGSGGPVELRMRKRREDYRREISSDVGERGVTIV